VAGFEGVIQGRPAAEYFLDTCSGCHGADRRGATRSALLPERLSQNDEYYAGVIADGKPGTVMPSFAAPPYELSPEDVETLVASSGPRPANRHRGPSTMCSPATRC
jgi:mono/diheme cytochrome c family protein